MSIVNIKTHPWKCNGLRFKQKKKKNIPAWGKQCNQKKAALTFFRSGHAWEAGWGGERLGPAYSCRFRPFLSEGIRHVALPCKILNIIWSGSRYCCWYTQVFLSWTHLQSHGGWGRIQVSRPFVKDPMHKIFHQIPSLCSPGTWKETFALTWDCQVASQKRWALY